MVLEDGNLLTITVDEEWFLVFDNVEDTTLGILNDYLPTGGKGSILITSRDPESEYSLTCLGCKVECLDSLEGKDFLMTQLPFHDVDDEKQMDNIVLLITHLAGLPLAIKQMGSFIRESGCSVNTLLDLLKDTTQFQEISANQTTFASKDYNHTLASVWAVSLSRLDSTALNLLRALSFLDPDSISGYILTALREFACGENRDDVCPFSTSTARYIYLARPAIVVNHNQILFEHSYSTKVRSDRTRS